MLARITTSRRQGQGREALSEGSRSAKVRAEGHELHRRLSLRASQHWMTKPNGCGGQGKCSGCARKAHALTRGDLSGMAMRTWTLKARRVCWLNKTQALQGAVTLRRANDTADVNASEARCRAICGVTGQKSAAAILATRFLTRKTVVKGQT
jgi:hypothetical protein